MKKLLALFISKLVIFSTAFIIMGSSCEPKDETWYDEMYSHDKSDAYARSLTNPSKDTPLNMTDGWIMTPQSNYTEIENYIINIRAQLNACQESQKK